MGAEGALRLSGPTGISAASPRRTRPSQSRVRGRRDPLENFPTTGDRGSVSPAPGAPGEESESGERRGPPPAATLACPGPTSAGTALWSLQGLLAPSYRTEWFRRSSFAGVVFPNVHPPTKRSAFAGGFLFGDFLCDWHVFHLGSTGCEGAVGLKTGSAQSLPGARRAHTPSSQQRLQSAPGESASTQPANEQHTPPRRAAACAPTARPQAPAPARGHKRLLRPRGKRTQGEATGRGEVRAADCGRGAGSRTRVPRSVGTL
ncbi:hypothetical protein NDU88_002468 [Pleurodeles waltl]|uniref:Uncharacterized protein n=1 Tax=Pleurodeles waltl TaxID=8319 RepID=A0AAV7RC22_PLEWA|nr:hypothetical protein NDU88_002468 [Pleurodeles waltl]